MLLLSSSPPLPPSSITSSTTNPILFDGRHSSSSPPATKVGELAKILIEVTPKAFRRAVQMSGGRFLYRGSTSSSNSSNDSSSPNDDNENERCRVIPVANELGVVRLCDPQPDLLLPETYGNDPQALLYFRCLEERLRLRHRRQLQQKQQTFFASPSNGHIGTSDPNVASQWGDSVVSVWPIGDEISTVWPKDTSVFYPPTTSANLDSKNCPRDERLVIDSRLEEALRRQDREVMFSTRTISGTSASNGDISFTYSPFMTVPIDYDRELRHELETINYGF